MLKKNQNTRVTGIGAALIDLLINETDEFLKKLNKTKGGMTHHQNHEIENILKKTSQKPVVVAGGAACNTIVGIGKLGGKARFIGKRGNDKYGTLFENQLIKSNVEPLFDISKTCTGKVLSVITPDFQRSMFTHLGAASKFNSNKITSNMFKNTAIAVIEGYLVINYEFIISVLKKAKKANSLICVDLSSFEVVESSKDIFKTIVKDYVDILIANEDEAKAFTGFSNKEKAIKALSENVYIAVLKVGEKGSYICSNNEILKIKPQTSSKVIDTTGAGDLWASGFLFGLANGYSLEKSGEIASLCGLEVCKVIGAHIPEQGIKRIKKIC